MHNSLMYAEFGNETIFRSCVVYHQSFRLSIVISRNSRVSVDSQQCIHYWFIGVISVRLFDICFMCSCCATKTLKFPGYAADGQCGFSAIAHQLQLRNYVANDSEISGTTFFDMTELDPTIVEECVY